MDSVDRLLLRQESDPRRRSTITLVVELEKMPDWETFVARLDGAARHEPRLRQRVVRPWRDLGAPVWVVEREIDVRAHLTRHRLPTPVSVAAIVTYLETIAHQDLDPSRPLWHMTMLDGAPGGRAAIVVRMSHVLTDGLAGMQLLAGLVDIGDQPLLPVGPADLETDRRGQVSLSPVRLAAEHILTAPARAQLLYWRNYASAVRIAGTVLVHPRRRIRQATDYAASLGRIAAPRTASPSFAERTATRRFTYIEVPADKLRDAGRSAGGTLNDAYLAAVMGGLRRYHELTGTSASEVPFAIPVSTRGRDHAARTSKDAGNRFAGVRFPAPVGVTDPAERIRRISAIVRAARAEPALDAMTTLAPALVQLPDRVLGLAGRAQDRLDMQASYVAGPPVQVGLAGVGIESMWALGPLPGPAAMSVLLTYAGVARIGFTVDAGAAPDVELLRQAMADGFDEVLALGEPASAPGGN